MEKFNIKARRTTLCNAGEKVKEMIKSGNGSFKTVVSPSINSGGYPLYIDEISEGWDNVYAIMKEITDSKGNKLDDTDIKMICDQSYEITDLDISGDPVITGTLSVLTGAQVNVDENIPDSLSALVEQKVKDGIVTKEEAEEKIDYMKKKQSRLVPNGESGKGMEAVCKESTQTVLFLC